MTKLDQTDDLLRFEFDPDYLSNKPFKPDSQVVLSDDLQILSELNHQFLSLYARLNAENLTLDDYTDEDEIEMQRLVEFFDLEDESDLDAREQFKHYLVQKGIDTKLAQDRVISALLQSRVGWHFLIFSAMNGVVTDYFSEGDSTRLLTDTARISVEKKNNDIFLTASCELEYCNRAMTVRTPICTCEAQLQLDATWQDKDVASLVYARGILKNKPALTGEIDAYFEKLTNASSSSMESSSDFDTLSMSSSDSFEELGIDDDVIAPRAPATLVSGSLRNIKQVTGKFQSTVKSHPWRYSLLVASTGFGVLGLLVGGVLAATGVGTPVGLALSMMSLDLAFTDTAMVFLTGLSCGAFAAAGAGIMRGVSQFRSRARTFITSKRTTSRTRVFTFKAPISASENSYFQDLESDLVQSLAALRASTPDLLFKKFNGSSNPERSEDYLEKDYDVDQHTAPGVV